MQVRDFFIFIFFKLWEVYEIILWNSAVPKAARRASEMVWGSRSTGLSQDFGSVKNAPLVAQRFWDGLRWSKGRLKSTESRKESL